MADGTADKSRFRRPFYMSIRAKMVVILTLLILALLGVAYHSIDRIAVLQVQEDLERQLLAVARAAAAGVDGDLHQQLVTSDLPAGRPLDDPRYRQLVDWLALVQTTHGLAPTAVGGEDHRLYVYTYVAGPQPDSVVLIGSSGAADPQPGGAAFRELLVAPSQTLLDGLQAPVARVDSVVRDRWGVWVTAAAPIQDSAGRAVGAVGVDMRDTTVVALQDRIRNSLLPAFITAGGILLIAAWLASRAITRPLGRLTAAAQTMAAGEPQTGPAGTHPRLLADEITTLAGAWETMLARVREREASLAYSEERYRALIDSLPGPAFLCDQQGCMTYIAPQIEDLLGYTPDEWIGADGCAWFQLVHPDDQEPLQYLLTQRDQVPDVGAVGIRLRQPDGGYHWVEGRYARFLASGDEWLVAGIIFDIQARQEAQQRLLDYNRELQIAYEELQETQQKLVRSAQLASIGELATTVAHEINNPLAVVRGLAQILISQRADDPELREPLGQIAANTERMARTVRTLRSLGRQGAERLEPMLLNQAVEDAVALVRAQLDEHGIELQTDLAPDLPPVQGVAHLLEQVVINLLTNARDAIVARGASGAPGSIIVRTRYDPQDDHVHLSVSDTGIGIPAEDHPHIFRPFFTTKPDGEGTGLGLSISYRIVQQHGGHIHFTSQPGVGTTFTVLLPAAPLEEAA
jgi:PAS domain S-box-containing protein